MKVRGARTAEDCPIDVELASHTWTSITRSRAENVRYDTRNSFDESRLIEYFRDLTQAAYFTDSDIPAMSPTLG